MPGGPEGPGAGGNDQKGPARPLGHESKYAFDSEALERAAKAAKDLEKSPHAKEVLELSRAQERTKQMEYE